ncbi:DUF4932 domain-containing protein [Mucilaginibacter terrae]|uniref:DUF4932 domain-containing protein n=1 Tax=Mucilaginibacter terrae TaxID=1955052 RepID=A0ABU3GQC0_9SPHI|nr:DUF4932 domain-containing protein [Mucilaginibacter terrae]MDT3401983.1 hypothetical protein [Mucilaginibacter terrae]
MKKILLLLFFATNQLHVNAQDKVSFDNAFQKANNNKSRVEISPLKELLHIMLAITKTGLANDDMVNQNGVYYQDVLKYFKPYSNEPIIKTFDSLLNASLYNYIFITGNAMTYDLSGTSLKRNRNYIFTATAVANAKVKINPIDTYKKQIEAFAKRSQFQKFYKLHKGYYANVISDYEHEANLDQQWKWLEKNFKTKINSYLILCSPLINGLNYTTEFKDKGFRQIVMVLPLLDHLPELTALQNELLNKRVMFTEIDHNYVNMPSIAHKATIDRVFKNRATWVNEKADGTYAYPTPLKVFDEYMTFATFLLFCKDNYDQTVYTETRKSVISVMIERGFTKMEAFVSILEKVRAAAPDKKVDELYPQLLEGINTTTNI